MTSRSTGLIQAYVSVILMGAGITIIQTLPLPSSSMVWYRVAIALPFLYIAARVQKKKIFIPRRLWKPLIVASVLTAAHWITLFISIKMSTVALGMISFYSYPVFAVVFEALIQKRKPLTRDLVVCGMILCGVMLLTPLTGASLELLPGVLTGVLSASLWSGRLVTVHHCLKELSGLNMMLGSLTVILVLLSPAVFLHPPSLEWDMKTIRGLLFLGIFVTAFCHTLLLSSLRHISATLVGQISPVQIVSASITGWYFLNEPLTPRILLGGFLVTSTGLFAVFLFKEDRKKPD